MTHTRRCILGVFAHPDDETSCAGGTFSRYAHTGVEVYVATATRGEQGMLGTHGQEVTREGLPRVRAMELCTVLRMYGARPPIFLGYRDQEVSHANADELITKIAAVMAAIMPDVVITFGPLGLSGHPDHVAVHHATVAAFHRYRHRTTDTHASITRLCFPRPCSPWASGSPAPRSSRPYSSILWPRRRSRCGPYGRTPRKRMRSVWRGSLSNRLGR